MKALLAVLAVAAIAPTDGTLSRLSLRWFGFDLTPKE